MRPLLPVLLLPLLATAAPFSSEHAIDFFREVPSRNLEGFASRSDGRLVAGPFVQPLAGELPADLLWSLAREDEHRWWVGAGPDGRILEVTLDLAARSYTAREVTRLADTQVFALLRLPNGDLLAGTSPRGTVQLLRDGAPRAARRLPADSVFDFLLQEDGTVLIATGQPGLIYRLDPARLAGAGVELEEIADEDNLTAAGLTLFGQVRDRNLRRLARAHDGRILAGSAPGGRLYAFPAAGGEPRILLEQSRSEITDILPAPSGEIYVAVVIDPTPTTTRVTRTQRDGEGADRDAERPPEPLMPDTAPTARFSGRSTLLRLPVGHAVPELATGRNNVAFHRLGWQDDQVLIAGGDEGELVGYEPAARRALTYAGSRAAQLSDLDRIDAHHWLLLENNRPGLAVIDFAGTGQRRAETRPLNLRSPGRLGAVRLPRIHDLDPAGVQLELRSNFSSDEVEGWSPWTSATWRDGGWHADEELTGQYLQVRLVVPAAAGPRPELHAANVYHLPQNRRPRLQAFRILPPNLAVVARPEGGGGSASADTLGQLVGTPRREEGGGEDRRVAQALLSSPVVPQPGAQVVYWQVDDPDGDNLTATFSIRHADEGDWHDLAVEVTNSFVQFDLTHLRDGLYFTRLVVAEQAPREPTERLSVSFSTDNLIVDRTPPVIEDVRVARDGERWRFTISGRDEASVLAGVRLNFNHGLTVNREHPIDGILDSLAETFVIELPAAQMFGATAVEIILLDQAGNSTARRVVLP